MNFSRLVLQDFRPGIKSYAHLGDQLIMAVMTLEGGLKDPGHTHPFDQCGLVLEGTFSLTIGDESQKLEPGQGYFIPAGNFHAWSVTKGPVKILDVSLKSQ
jgi:quercetin dioxygenase-like cupin family protein